MASKGSSASAVKKSVIAKTATKKQPISEPKADASTKSVEKAEKPKSANVAEKVASSETSKKETQTRRKTSQKQKEPEVSYVNSEDPVNAVTSSDNQSGDEQVGATAA